MTTCSTTCSSALAALIVVPPFVKSTAGPPLGPAMLAGAARDAGLDVEVLDLAIEEVRSAVDAAQLGVASGLAGDHDKNEPALRQAQDDFFASVAPTTGLPVAALRACALSWSELDLATAALALTVWARSVEARLARLAAPALVGVSVMFSEQVLAALVISKIVRRLWPSTTIVWGGAQVTALAPEIAADARYGRGIDGFVAGYAERTFLSLVEANVSGHPWPPEVFSAGGGQWTRAIGALTTVPRFGSLDRYGSPRLTLPAQLTRGCAYGKCGFCTYPHVEGQYIEPGAELSHLAPTVSLAQAHGAVVSFKDALMTVPNLRRIAELLRGRVRWSACTKLAPGLVEILPLLAASGCETLEIGLETIVRTSQLTIDKTVSHGLVTRFLAESRRVGIRIVVNYMTGLPGESPPDAASGLAWIRAQAAAANAVVEHHTFELERRAPLAKVLRATSSWPWASILEWTAEPQQEAA